MVAFSQTTFAHAFSCIKMLEFRLTEVRCQALN